jgi:hypothetical protein
VLSYKGRTLTWCACMVCVYWGSLDGLPGSGERRLVLSVKPSRVVVLNLGCILELLGILL